MKVTFNINFHTVWGQKLCVVGSIPELGSWEPALAKEMNYSGDGNWKLELDLPPDIKDIEYRYFLSVNDKQIFEEWEKNHRIVLDGQSDSYILYDYWQIRPDNLAFYSSAFTKSLFAHPCNTHERVVRSGRKLVIKISAPRVEKNQCVAITGNQECLGNWHPDKALLLSCDTFPEWHIDLDAAEIRYPLEYKFLVWDNDSRQPLYWESDENRILSLVPQKQGETVVISGLYFRDSLPLWRCAGSVIPVFSLRYDNGGSLLAWATDEELTDTKLRYQFDKSKPFRSRHAQQIKLIDEPVLPVRDLDTLYQEIMQAISPILALLSEKRASAIRQYLKYRLHYLKAAMG